MWVLRVQLAWLGPLGGCTTLVDSSLLLVPGMALAWHSTQMTARSLKASRSRSSVADRHDGGVYVLAVWYCRAVLACHVSGTRSDSEPSQHGIAIVQQTAMQYNYVKGTCQQEVSAYFYCGTETF